MVLSVRLQAIRRANEVLRSDVSQRPDVVIGASAPNLGGFGSSSTTVTLGKNATTMIADSNLKRKCVSVTLLPNSNELRLEKAVPQQVSVNGQLVEGDGYQLQEGDILSLHGTEIAYEFKVIAEGGSLAKKKEPEASATVQKPSSDCNGNTATLASSSASLQQQQYNSHISDEFSCAFCLELLVQTTTIVPCGHSFCLGCLEQVNECPTCRGAVQTTVPCRSMDNVIAAMASQPAQSCCFAPDDLQKYHERLPPDQQKKKQTTTSGSPMRRNKKRKTIGGGDTPSAAICVD